MKRLDQTDAYLGICAGASALLIATALLGGCARVGSTVVVGASTSAPTTTAGTPRATAEATAVGVTTSALAVATPTVEDFDGSQRAMPYELYSAIVTNFPPAEVPNAIAVVKCETGRTWRGDLVSVDGAQGAFQVLARFHGAVPADYFGQARQAAGIVAENGWRLWSCQP